MKPTVCVDLDGVLAHYESGWLRNGKIGSPIPGARGFMDRLSKDFHLVIHTSRIDSNGGGRINPFIVKQVGAWLEKHRIPYDEIHVGIGKPGAVAYVDDRAASCRPQAGGEQEFNRAEAVIRQLTNAGGGC